MKKILVPVDGSEYADLAATRAGEFAKEYDAEVTLLNVNTVFTAMLGFKDRDELLKDAEKTARESAERLKKEGVKAKAVGVLGDPADEIVNLAEEKGSDLIVIGSKGLTESQRFLVGSVTQKVVEHAPCSVLVVK